MHDIEPLRLEQRDEQLPALVVTLSRRDAVGNRDDAGSQTGSFVFSTSVTSVTFIPLSIAFAMS
jgi:hypothetical protein